MYIIVNKSMYSTLVSCSVLVNDNIITNLFLNRRFSIFLFMILEVLGNTDAFKSVFKMLAICDYWSRPFERFHVLCNVAIYKTIK